MGETSWQVATHLNPPLFFWAVSLRSVRVVHTRTPSFPSCRPLVVVGEYVAIVRDENELVTHLLNFDYLMGALKVEIACRWGILRMEFSREVLTCWW